MALDFQNAGAVQIKYHVIPDPSLVVATKSLEKQYLTRCLEGYVSKEQLNCPDNKYKVTFVAVRCTEFAADSGGHYVNNNLTL